MAFGEVVFRCMIISYNNLLCKQHVVLFWVYCTLLLLLCTNELYQRLFGDA